LLTLLCHEGFRIYEKFTWIPAGNENKIAPVLAKSDAHFQPRKVKLLSSTSLSLVNNVMVSHVNRFVGTSVPHLNV
jgi:hypothetical protein